MSSTAATARQMINEYGTMPIPSSATGRSEDGICPAGTPFV